MVTPINHNLNKSTYSTIVLSLYICVFFTPVVNNHTHIQTVLNLPGAGAAATGTGAGAAGAGAGAGAGAAKTGAGAGNGAAATTGAADT